MKNLDILIEPSSSEHSLVEFTYDLANNCIKYYPLNKANRDFKAQYDIDLIAEKIRHYASLGKRNLKITINETPYNVFISGVDSDETKLVSVILSPAMKKGTMDFNDLHKLKLLSLGEMTAGIIHDIKNPINMSLTSIELLKFKIEELEEEIDDKSEEMIDLLNDIKKKIDFLENGNSRINDVVEGISSLSRKEQVEFKEFSLNEFLRKNTSFLKYELDKKGVSLDIKLKDSIILKGKESLLAQVIVNIVKNAIDAVEDQPFNKKWIEVDAKDNNDFIEIYVKDSGKGIPNEIKDKILEPFFTTKELGKGTGLGLSLTKQILELHNGNLSIDNSKETTFILKISKNL